MLYQVGSRHNSSPTLEVGVFLLEKDKKSLHIIKYYKIKTCQMQFGHSLFLMYSMFTIANEK